MKTPAISYQPNFQGKLFLSAKTTRELTRMGTNFDDIKALVKNKPYNLNITTKKGQPELLVLTFGKKPNKPQYLCATVYANRLREIVKGFIKDFENPII